MELNGTTELANGTLNYIYSIVFMEILQGLNPYNSAAIVMQQ
jgi:hypothetical protein